MQPPVMQPPVMQRLRPMRPRRGPGLSCLVLVTDGFGGAGGIAQYNRDFLAALAALPGISAVAVLPCNPGNPIFLPERITQAPPRRGRLRYVAGTIVASLARLPDLVFCGHLHLAPLAAAIARIARARLIVQAHGVEIWATPSRVRRRAIERADLVLSVSRHTRAAVLAWADLPPERVVVVPNTVGDLFTPGDDFTPGDGSTLRTAWGLAGKRVLLTVGRLDPCERYKGHDRVIAAIPDLVARGHDIAYVVIGDGDDRSRLAGIARRLGVADRVHFVGFAAPETLVASYRMADLFVMPSTGEGFGIAFLEAMASGTPALGLAVGGASDALADGELGTALGRDDDLAAAIDRVLSGSRPDPRALAEQTRARFGRDAFTARLRLALERVCPPGMDKPACPGT
jgi:phosphatidylinositol alpha-1,6-mannosyltransferase